MRRRKIYKSEEKDESEGEVCGVCGEEAEGERVFCGEEDREVDQSMEEDI